MSKKYINIRKPLDFNLQRSVIRSLWGSGIVTESQDILPPPAFPPPLLRLLFKKKSPPTFAAGLARASEHLKPDKIPSCQKVKPTRRTTKREREGWLVVVGEIGGLRPRHDQSSAFLLLLTATTYCIQEPNPTNHHGRTLPAADQASRPEKRKKKRKQEKETRCLYSKAILLSAGRSVV